MEDGNESQDSDKLVKITKSKNKQRKELNLVEVKRPIIFICNDLYTKALRPLKELSLQVKIDGADQKRICQRLRFICRQEGVKVDDEVIQDIVDESKNDARSSITSLQLISKGFKEERVSSSNL
jgi:DNA polymerase III delta prime subunit